jgi:hypothetical protein
MRGAIDSLNAAVAGSILVFEVVAQRDPEGRGAAAPAASSPPAASGGDPPPQPADDAGEGEAQSPEVAPGPKPVESVESVEASAGPPAAAATEPGAEPAEPGAEPAHEPPSDELLPGAEPAEPAAEPAHEPPSDELLPGGPEVGHA